MIAAREDRDLWELVEWLRKSLKMKSCSSLQSKKKLYQIKSRVSFKLKIELKRSKRGEMNDLLKVSS